MLKLLLAQTKILAYIPLILQGFRTLHSKIIKIKYAGSFYCHRWGGDA